MSGYLTFLMGGRELAADLSQVREIVRAAGVEPLRGVRAPVTGLLELRGDPLPVVDLRDAMDPFGTGDVIVLSAGDDGPLGLAVDTVVAVIGEDELVQDDGPRPYGLPAYVVEVMRTTDLARRPVLLVDLRTLAGLRSEPPQAAARS